MNNVHFAIPEIYGETLSYYELLRKLVNKTNELIENYNTVPEQIAEAVANLDASQLFSAVLEQLINSIATDNTKSANAVKVYKKHDLLYATFNETVNLYESLIDFTTGTETELIVGSNIREVNISELFIELRKLIEDEAMTREQDDTALQTNIDNEARAREQADTTKVNKSDVLTAEEIQASTDLTGKIASASGLKEAFDIINLSIKVPNNIGGKDNIIRNCKYISSIIEPYKPRMLVIQKDGRGFVIGYTYEQTADTHFAQYIYYKIGLNNLFLVNCYNGVWNVVEFSGAGL